MRHLLIPVLLLGCSGLDRSNPYDPANGPGETTELTLSLPLGKVLASVIHRVEAVITSPTTPTILRQLDITPLGPDRLQEQEADQLLEQIIVDLPQNLRDVFLLSRFRRMTNHDIAEHLGISVKTVEWRMSKAMEHCMTKLRG